jgi:hybrid cluster-associated redox disulfide protein
LCWNKDRVNQCIKDSIQVGDAPMPIGFDDLVDDVMKDFPATIRVFIDFKMGCIGCPIACFHTVEDACGEHHVNRDAFLEALREVVT